jgi:hypothetical protein
MIRVDIVRYRKIFTVMQYSNLTHRNFLPSSFWDDCEPESIVSAARFIIGEMLGAGGAAGILS